MATVTANQALALIQTELSKTSGANKSAAVRAATNLKIQMDRLGIGGNVVMTIEDPPKRRSGRGSKRPSARKAERKSASSITGRRQ
jgi:hypothetical protein